MLSRLQRAGHQAFLVGGSLRDALLGRDPHDWDVATDARPDQVQALFARSIPTGIDYGTVTVPAETDDTVGADGGERGWGDERVERNERLDGANIASRLPVEVTTFRRDLPYRDGRRPSGVRYGDRIEEDLARRDFTVNALAWNSRSPDLIDPWGGAADLDEGVIRAVGNPGERLREDALRILRAVRFAAQLGFSINPETWEALGREAGRVRLLSAERVRDELLKILGSPRPEEGLRMLHELDILYPVLPELRGTERLPQAKAGTPYLLDHLIRTAASCPPDPVLRMAALLHDAGKMTTRTVDPSGRVTFHGHEQAGAQAARAACRRLRMSREATRRITTLIDMHMVCGDITPKGVRRWVAGHGEAWVRDLLLLRRADHIAGGHGPENPWADRMDGILDQVMEEESALRVRDLAVDGNDVMKLLGLLPGPAVGEALEWLLDQVLEDPSKNERERLLKLLAEYRRVRP